MKSAERVMLLSLFLTAMTAGASAPGSPPTASRAFAVHSIALPGASAAGVSMDYLAYDRAHHRVWVPAGNTGSVDVVDAGSEQVHQVAGFPTAQVEWRGVKRTVGPSSATVGAGVVYVGNRGDATVCAVDAESLRVGACIKLDSSPDGLAYVAPNREVWVTTPRARSIVILDAAAPGALTAKATIHLDGAPEGFAVDAARGVFYTNLEDKDRTLKIDLQSRAIASTWPTGCGERGPRGLGLDHGLDFLMVACVDRVLVLDAGHGGKRLSTLAVGEGLDNLDYAEARHELYAAAGRAARLAIAQLDSQGRLTAVATVPTAPGARNAVVSDEGIAYVTDSPESKLLVVAPATSR